MTPPLNPWLTMKAGKYLAEMAQGYFDARDREEERIAKEREEKKRQKEIKKLNEEIQKELDFQAMLRYGAPEIIEAYFHRTWLFEHFDHDRLCAFDPYGERRWKWYRTGYDD